jgi:hypothetical protein
MNGGREWTWPRDHSRNIRPARRDRTDSEIRFVLLECRTHCLSAKQARSAAIGDLQEDLLKVSASLVRCSKIV